MNSYQLHVKLLSQSRELSQGQLLLRTEPHRQDPGLSHSRDTFLLPSHPASSNLLSPVRTSVAVLALFFIVFAPLEGLRGFVWGGNPPKGRQHPCMPGFQKLLSFAETQHLYHTPHPQQTHCLEVLGQVVG